MNMKGIFFGSFFSLLTVLAALLVSAALIYFNVIPEKTASVIVFAAIAAGVFFSSFIVCRASERRLLPNAFGISAVFCIFVLVLSFIANNGFEFHIRTAAVMFASVGASFLGAVLANR